MRLITLSVRTCRPLANERRAHAAGVLCQHFDVVGGSRLQVGQSVRAHVSNEEVDGLVHAWKHREVSEKLKRSKNQVTAFRNQDIIHNVCACLINRNGFVKAHLQGCRSAGIPGWVQSPGPRPP